MTYHNIIDEGLVGQKQIEVMKYIVDHPNSTDKEISVNTGLNINCVTGRRNELLNYGIVEDNGKKICDISGRTVYQWVLKTNLPSIDDIRKSKKYMKIKCPVCKGVGYIARGQQTLC